MALTLASIVLASSPAASGCVISLPVEILLSVGNMHASLTRKHACAHELLTRVRVAKIVHVIGYHAGMMILCMHLYYVINMFNSTNWIRTSFSNS